MAELTILKVLMLIRIAISWHDVNHKITAILNIYCVDLWLYYF